MLHIFDAMSALGASKVETNVSSDKTPTVSWTGIVYMRWHEIRLGGGLRVPYSQYFPYLLGFHATPALGASMVETNVSSNKTPTVSWTGMGR